MQSEPSEPPFDPSFEPPPEDELAGFRHAACRIGGGRHAAANLREAALEAYCLRMLLLQPKLIYDVNRKFRELAADQPRWRTACSAT